MGKKKKPEYYCIKTTPLFSGKETDEIIKDIELKTVCLYWGHDANIGQGEYFNTRLKIWFFYKKIWMIPAPEHAIVAAKLIGEI